ncbi:MAG: DinB family protein [Bacteroidetes bacterium]|nr:DinB family protein [Bacteroidota bacterium]
MSKSSVLQQFEKLELSKRQILSQISSLDPSVLHYRPAYKKWSIVQILFHLNSSESISLKYMQKKSQGGTSVPKSTPVNALRSFILTAALRTLKWKRPAVLPEPPDQPDLNEVLQSWNETRRQLKQLLQNLPDDMMNRNIFRHPAAGRMNISHALTFMQEHTDHHLKQIRERISPAKKTS